MYQRAIRINVRFVSTYALYQGMPSGIP